MAEYTPNKREMASGDYIQLFNWRITGWKFGRRVQVEVEEQRSRAKIKIPQAVWQIGALDKAAYTYPNLDSSAEGGLVPIGIGKVLRAPVVLVDGGGESPTEYTFRVVGHAINSFDGFYVDGEQVSAQSFDLATSEFTLSSAVYDGVAEVRVDFTALYDNVADVIEWLLETWGGEPTTNLHKPGSGDPDEGEGFGTYGSRTNWVRGHLNSFSSGTERSLYALSKFIDSEEDLMDLCDELAGFCGGLFFNNRQGKYTLRTWNPQPAEGFMRFDQTIEGEIRDVVPEAMPNEAVTRVIARYRKRLDETGQQFLVEGSEPLRRRRGLKEHALLDQELPFHYREDALLWAGRTLAMRGPPLRVYRATVFRKGATLLPGDGVWLSYARRNLNGPFEVIGVSWKPGSKTCELRLVDWRGLGDEHAFWLAASPAMPSYLGGRDMDPWDADSLPWDADELRFAQTDGGYWQDDNGFAQDGTEEARDYSRWTGP